MDRLLDSVFRHLLCVFETTLGPFHPIVISLGGPLVGATAQHIKSHFPPNRTLVLARLHIPADFWHYICFSSRIDFDWLFTITVEKASRTHSIYTPAFMDPEGYCPVIISHGSPSY